MSAAEGLYNALQVIVKDPKIAEALDPKAFRQALNALWDYDYERGADAQAFPSDDHCESDGSGICLVHFGRLEDTDGSDGPDVCDLSPLSGDYDEPETLYVQGVADGRHGVEKRRDSAQYDQGYGEGSRERAETLDALADNETEDPEEYHRLRAEAARLRGDDTYPAGTPIETYLRDEGTTIEEFIKGE